MYEKITILHHYFLILTHYSDYTCGRFRRSICVIGETTPPEGLAVTLTLLEMSIEKGEHIGALVLKHINGTIGESERAELDAWRRESPENEDIFVRMTSREAVNDAVNRVTRDDDAGWEALKGRIARGKRRRRAAVLKYAAVAAVLITAGIAGNRYFAGSADDSSVFAYTADVVVITPDGNSIHLPGQDVVDASEYLLAADGSTPTAKETPADTATRYTTVRVNHGSNKVISFPDGTRVHLNAGTELVFPENLAERERRVELRYGEAYFDVARDEQRPFLVTTGPVTVRVLGTTFGVRAYEDESSIEAILESGSVEMLTDTGTAVIVPNQKASFEKRTGAIHVVQADVENLLAWTRDRLAFDNTTLGEIFRQLKRQYTFEMIFEDGMENKRMSFDIDKKETLNEILDLMESTGKVGFRIRGDTITVTSRE